MIIVYRYAVTEIITTLFHLSQLDFWVRKIRRAFKAYRIVVWAIKVQVDFVNTNHITRLHDQLETNRFEISAAGKAAAKRSGVMAVCAIKISGIIQADGTLVRLCALRYSTL